MKRWLLLIIPAIIALIIDLITKSAVFDYAAKNGNITFIENFLYFTIAHNKGVAFGLLQNSHSLLFYFIPLIIIGIPFYIFLNKTLPLFQVFLFGLILGGAMGNYYDRALVEGGVRDFIHVVIFSWDFPIFNVADAFISCSVFVLVIISLFEKEKVKPSQSEK
jgi:signal peptidase II